MAVRPFLTAGAALFAGAGLVVAAAPVVTPPLAQRDVQIAAAQIDPALRNAAIDGFIAGGSLQSALTALQAVVGDEGAQAVIQSFIDGGALQAAIFAVGGGDPVVDAFIEGGALQAAIVGVAGEDDPVANAFIEGGALQAAIVGVAGEDDPVANAFIEGGALQAAIVGLAPPGPETDAFIEGGLLQSAIVKAENCTTSDCSPEVDEETEEVINTNAPLANAFINGGALEAGLTALKVPETTPVTTTGLVETGVTEETAEGGSNNKQGEVRESLSFEPKGITTLFGVKSGDGGSNEGDLGPGSKLLKKLGLGTGGDAEE